MWTNNLAASAAMLAVATAAPPAASAANSVYGGHLGTEDDPIVLTASAAGTKLNGSVIAFTARCTASDGTTSSRVFHQEVPVVPAKPGVLRFGAWQMTRNAKGRFTGTYALPQNVNGMGLTLNMQITGTLKPGTASGTFSANSILTSVPAISAQPPTGPAEMLDTCATGVLRWKATHSPGIVYGGSTAQDEPIVVRLSKTRKKVADVDLGWHASCVPDGFVDFPETFTSFPLAATGTFGAAFTQKYPVTDGSGVNVYNYNLGGKVGRRSASGSFQAKVTYPNGSSCDTGAQRWTAAST